MPWNTLATIDVTAEILPDEVTLLNTIQGASTILAAILANVVAEVQASILTGGNQIGPAGTVPDQIREDSIALARWRWFTSLPMTDLQSDARRQQYREAQARLQGIREGKEKVEIPEAAQNVTGPSFRAQLIRRGHRVETHTFDKMGET